MQPKYNPIIEFRKLLDYWRIGRQCADDILQGKAGLRRGRSRYYTWQLIREIEGTLDIAPDLEHRYREPLLDTAEIKDRYGICRRSAHRWLTTGSLAGVPLIRLGRRILRVRPIDLERADAALTGSPLLHGMDGDIAPTFRLRTVAGVMSVSPKENECPLNADIERIREKRSP